MQVLIFFTVVTFLVKASHITANMEVHYYLNKWTVKIQGGMNEVNEIADKFGFTDVKEVSGLQSVYIMSHNKCPQKGKYKNDIITETLRRNKEIIWAKQMSMEKDESRQINLMCPHGEESAAIPLYHDLVNDLLWIQQWYMQKCGVNNGATYDINVVPVWLEHTIFGKGIVVVVVDDGVQYTHPDLFPNWSAYYGLNVVEGNYDPMPNIAVIPVSHGTKCAGVIAMQANNSICGVGIAPLVIIGAVRMLGGGGCTDEQKHTALTFKVREVHVMNNSWGPTDNGLEMPALGKLIASAIKEGIQTGRWGTGVIYVFAAGNGKMKYDNCACDPNVSSIFTIGVAAATHLGLTAKYSERCSSILVTAYSGDGWSSHNLISTDVNNECTRTFSGTSGAAPIITGIVALALEANPNLTWREVQHLFVWTSEVAPLANNYGWKRNAAGFWYSMDFGFGLVNAYNLVTLAKSFKRIPPMSSCVTEVELKYKQTNISREAGLRIRINSTACKTLPTEIRFLEHVQIVTTIKYTRRGDLSIVLKSPSGTESILLEPRKYDSYTGGIEDWHFDTVHFWGEPVEGEWTLDIFDKVGYDINEGNVEEVVLILHGTKEQPPHYKKGVRSYYEFKTPEMKEENKS